MMGVVMVMILTMVILCVVSCVCRCAVCIIAIRLDSLAQHSCYIVLVPIGAVVVVQHATIALVEIHEGEVAARVVAKVVVLWENVWLIVQIVLLLSCLLIYGELVADISAFIVHSSVQFVHTCRQLPHQLISADLLLINLYCLPLKGSIVPTVLPMRAVHCGLSGDALDDVGALLLHEFVDLIAEIVPA